MDRISSIFGVARYNVVLITLKTWPNGGAIQVNASSKLASPFGHVVRALALTCVHFGRNQSYSSFGHLTHVTMSFACTCESVWPPNASLYASLTCDYLRPLVLPFYLGLKLAFETIRPALTYKAISSISTFPHPAAHRGVTPCF